MSIQDLEAEVEHLSSSELAIFSKYFWKFAATFCRGSAGQGRHREVSKTGCADQDPLREPVRISNHEFTRTDANYREEPRMTRMTRMFGNDEARIQPSVFDRMNSAAAAGPDGSS
jgi:hypothetical protein